MERWLFITIDTEEDEWGSYGTRHPAVENLKNIRLLQDILRKHDAVPTYLIDYPVATDGYGIRLLRSMMENGQCDIGTHCHPWNTPPYVEAPGKHNSLLCNLPENLVGEKLQNVHDAIVKNFGIRPLVFRAGRWGIGRAVLESLQKLGYEIDTSIRPFTPGQGLTRTAPVLLSNSPFWMEAEGGCGETAAGSGCRNPGARRLMEIPPSIGFLQKDFERCYRIRRSLRSYWAGRCVALLLKGARIINPVWLSPEYCGSSSEMIALTKSMIRNGHTILNLFFHSTTLLPGKTPYVRTQGDLRSFLKKIDEYLAFASRENIRCIGMSGARDLVVRATAAGSPIPVRSPFAGGGGRRWGASHERPIRRISKAS